MGINTIPSRCDWFSNFKNSIFEDKNRIIDHYIKMLFTRSNMIFEYKNLPDTIPKVDIELIKQTYGSVTIAKNDDGKIYAFYGGLGGELNEYYHPTISIVTNPYLKLSKTYVIGKDCVVIKNDLFYEGLYVLNRKYAELLTECDISIRKCLLNIRVDNIAVSHDDDTSASLKEFFDDVEKGKFGYVGSKKFLDESLIQIHSIASTSHNPLKDLIEMRNYIDSSWYIEIGLNANYNMKRESLTDAETNVDDKTLIPFIQQMYDMGKLGVEEMNEMFDLNVEFDFSPVWKKMYDEVVNTPIEEPSNDNTSTSEEQQEEPKEGENNG
ncbi:MAG: hypothetical protein IKT40_14445 [Bacilli bacterium]|nr:hypothetical protein [Bacilli bacterium]